MASITWPTKFPNPTVSFNGKVNQTVKRTKMDSGRIRQIARFTSELRVFTARWEFTNVQFEAFQSWVKYKLHNGADAFNIALPLGNSTTAFKTVEARIVNGEYSWSHKGILQWEVSCQLEVENAAVLSEALLNVYLAS